MTQGGRSSGLTLDWSGGFALYDTETRDYQWRYKFSQLKGSSDDSKTKLKLHFQNENKEIETKVGRGFSILFVCLFLLLCCVDAMFWDASDKKGLIVSLEKCCFEFIHLGDISLFNFSFFIVLLLLIFP